MRLISLEDTLSLPDSGNVDVIVFTYDSKVVGLVVKQIIDIVHAPFNIKITSKESKEQGYLGSMVINQKTTDVVDVACLLSDFIDQAINDMGDISKVKAADSKLLLVEDSMFFRNLTVPFLAAAGYKVTSTDNAKAALDLLGNQSFDMIVTDIEMPGMNGFDFAAACRSNPSLGGAIPIVAYTATMSDEVVKRCQAVGMQDCIVKTDRPKLLESVARYLSHRKEIAA